MERPIRVGSYGIFFQRKSVLARARKISKYGCLLKLEISGTYLLITIF